MGIDFTRLVEKLNPDPGGEDVLRLRVGTVSAISSTGSATITLSGTPVPGVPALNNAVFAVGTAVQVLSFRGSLLILGAAGAVSSQPVGLNAGSTASEQVTSTTFTNVTLTGGPFGVAFVAPASGKVNVVGRAMGLNGTATNYTYLDFEIRTGSTVGSGSVVRAGSGNTEVAGFAAANNAQTLLTTGDLVSGLTPGALYNACLVYRAGANTSAYNRRSIQVYPL